MKKWFCTMLALLAFSTLPAWAQEAPDLRANSPAITELRDALRTRFAQIKPLLETGTLGIAANGFLAVRDPAAVPIADRQAVSALIAADTRDKTALYREIARANGHPEWETQIADTFNRIMREKIPAGWWLQGENGQWSQK
jgi:uncharacterized protein YdbL (DUF1318 family)